MYLRAVMIFLTVCILFVSGACAIGAEYVNSATGKTLSGNLESLQGAVVLGDDISVMIMAPNCVRRFECQEYAVTATAVCCSMPLSMPNLNCQTLDYDSVAGVMQWCTDGFERVRIGNRLYKNRFQMLWTF